MNLSLVRERGFNDTELHNGDGRLGRRAMSIVQIQWKYDTQPYVPYTVLKQF